MGCGASQFAKSPAAAVAPVPAADIPPVSSRTLISVVPRQPSTLNVVLDAWTDGSGPPRSPAQSKGLNGMPAMADSRDDSDCIPHPTSDPSTPSPAQNSISGRSPRFVDVPKSPSMFSAPHSPTVAGDGQQSPASPGSRRFAFPVGSGNWASAESGTQSPRRLSPRKSVTSTLNNIGPDHAADPVPAPPVSTADAVGVNGSESSATFDPAAAVPDGLPDPQSWARTFFKSAVRIHSLFRANRSDEGVEIPRLNLKSSPALSSVDHSTDYGVDPTVRSTENPGDDYFSSVNDRNGARSVDEIPISDFQRFEQEVPGSPGRRARISPTKNSPRNSPRSFNGYCESTAFSGNSPREYSNVDGAGTIGANEAVANVDSGQPQQPSSPTIAKMTTDEFSSFFFDCPEDPELSSALKMLSKKLDTDGDGYLSDEDYVQMLGACFIKPRQEKIEFTFNLFDSERDGTWKVEDFSSFLDITCRILLSRCTPLRGCSEWAWNEALQAWTHDNSGSFPENIDDIFGNQNPSNGSDSFINTAPLPLVDPHDEVPVEAEAVDTFGNPVGPEFGTGYSRNRPRIAMHALSAVKAMSNSNILRNSGAPQMQGTEFDDSDFSTPSQSFRSRNLKPGGSILKSRNAGTRLKDPKSASVSSVLSNSAADPNSLMGFVESLKAHMPHDKGDVNAKSSVMLHSMYNELDVPFGTPLTVEDFQTLCDRHFILLQYMNELAMLCLRNRRIPEEYAFMVLKEYSINAR